MFVLAALLVFLLVLLLALLSAVPQRLPVTTLLSSVIRVVQFRRLISSSLFAEGLRNPVLVVFAGNNGGRARSVEF